MSTTEHNQSYQPYVFAITEQVAQHISALNELSDLINQRGLSFNERSAVERSLQVVVEAIIGCSKHYLKSLGKPIPAEARATIQRAYELLAIASPDIKDLIGAIGMRNAIIHDYLNLDWNKLEVVLKSKKYQLLEQYQRLVCNKLLANNH